MKKIIILLTLIILILIAAVFAFRLSRNSTIQTGEEAIPTGIIVPTREITNGELDIVAISPRDDEKNVSPDRSIEITFSRTFTLNEIEFFIIPNTSHDTQIETNKLIISPTEAWEPGTYHTFSINFEGEPEKVRLYHFTTSGPTAEFLPDTQPEGSYEHLLEDQRVNDTDNYVTNHTPYETNTFSVRAEYDPNPPAHFYFIVNIKDETRGQQDFDVWLQTLDLTSEQINSLDVRFE